MRERHAWGGVIAGIGLGLGVLQVRGVGGGPVSLGFNVIPFGLVAAALVYVGMHVARGGVTDRHARRVLGWALGGSVLFAAVTALVALDGGVRGDLAALASATVDNVTAGALAGVLVGLYDARSLERLAEIERRRDRIEAFAGEAASLNRYGKALNESTSLEGVSALCIEAVEVVIGRPGAAFVLVEDGRARIVDDTFIDEEARHFVREVASETPERSEIEVTIHDDRAGDGGAPLSIPIPIDAARRAVLVATTDESEYEDEEIDLLELLAAHASTALANLDREGKRMT